MYSHGHMMKMALEFEVEAQMKKGRKEDEKDMGDGGYGKKHEGWLPWFNYWSPRLPYFSVHLFVQFSGGIAYPMLLIHVGSLCLYQRQWSTGVYLVISTWGR